MVKHNQQEKNTQKRGFIDFQHFQSRKQNDQS